MNKIDFEELARNTPRDADMALFDLVQEQAATIQGQTATIAQLRADLDGLADMVAHLSAPAAG